MSSMLESFFSFTTGDVLHTTMWVVALGTGSVLLALYFFQDNLLYFPNMPPDARTMFIPASQFGLRHALTEVFFTTSDNLKLQAYFVKHTHSTEVPTILYFHGNAGNLSFRLPNIKHLVGTDVGCNVFIVSYRGYGKSEGKPSEKGLQLDAKAALEYLHASPDIDPHKIVAFGRSLGGAVAARLTFENEDKIAALIVENTFTSIPDMIDVVMPWLGYFKALSTNKWNTKEFIKDISVPILFLSGAKDELVPSRMMKELYDAAENSRGKHLAIFEDGAHMNTFTRPGYYGVVRKWLQKVFDAKSSSATPVEEEGEGEEKEN